MTRAGRKASMRPETSEPMRMKGMPSSRMLRKATQMSPCWLGGGNDTACSLRWVGRCASRGVGVCGGGSGFALGFGVALGAVEVREFFEVHPADAGGFDG